MGLVEQARENGVVYLGAGGQPIRTLYADGDAHPSRAGTRRGLRERDDRLGTGGAAAVQSGVRAR